MKINKSRIKYIAYELQTVNFVQQAIVCLFVAKAGYTSSARRRCLFSLERVKHGLGILLNIRSLVVARKWHQADRICCDLAQVISPE